MLISLNIQSQRHSLCALGCIYIPNISIVITLREGEGGGGLEWEPRTCKNPYQNPYILSLYGQKEEYTYKSQIA